MTRIEQNRVTLKSIKFSEALSEETNAFTADIFFDGKKIGYAKNDGHGGCTDYNRYPDKMDKLKECMAFCESLPQIDLGHFQIDCNLENVIDDLFEDWLKQREQKQLEKKMQTSILFGVPNAMSYSYINFKQPLKAMHKPLLQAHVSKIVRDHCTGDVRILNTNLKELGITF